MLSMNLQKKQKKQMDLYLVLQFIMQELGHWRIINPVPFNIFVFNLIDAAVLTYHDRHNVITACPTKKFDIERCITDLHR